MQSHGTTKINGHSDYYQVRANCDSEELIYLDEADYNFFLSLLGKLSLKNDSVEALAYCLAPDHFCLLLNQTDNGGIERLMHGIVTGYNNFYFEKYKVEDLLSESNYKTNKILAGDLLNVSCRLHLSPDDWMECPYSSIRAYFYDDVPNWLNKTHIADKYGSAVKYLEFLQDCN